MSPQHTDSAAPSERTPLIPPAPSALPSPSPTLAPSDSPKHSSSSPGSTSTGLFPPIRRVLFTSFLLSMTFAFTQTSLIYAFRTMTCDEWYKTHPFPGQVGDICATPAIEARTAKSVALMSSVTTTCTILNLFITGFWIKRFGVKAAMFQQTAWAAMRNLTQIYAQTIGGGTGIQIIQTTQFFNIMGSGGGYQLAANAFIAALATPEKRTSMFGVLGGIVMAGSSAGYTFGGLVFTFLGPLAPFQVTFCLLVFCTIFGSIFLPYIPPEDANAHTPADSGNGNSNGNGKTSTKNKRSFLSPLKIFVPRRTTDADGRTRWDLNLTLLGLGAFFSVLATGYVPMGLQLVGTNVFGFKPAESGMMLSLTLMVRAFFLSICFPRIISSGRRFLTRAPPSPSPSPPSPSPSPSGPDSPLPPPSPARSDTYDSARPDSPEQADEPNVVSAPREDLPSAPTDTAHGSLFDLYFLRYSIFTDGILTAGISLATRPYHLYLAAAVLPFASGTGPACKGVVLDLVDASDRADALGAIALVEKLAQVSTIGMFGVVFSWLSEAGKPTMVFLANASIAMVGFMLLLFVRMQRTGQIALA